MQNLNCTCRHAWNVQAQNINEVNNKIVLTINVLSGLGMSSAADNVIASESDITHSCAFLLLFMVRNSSIAGYDDLSSEFSTNLKQN